MRERVDPLHPLDATNALPGTRIQHKSTGRRATIVRQEWPQVWVIEDGQRNTRHRKIYATQFRLLMAVDEA